MPFIVVITLHGLLGQDLYTVRPLYDQFTSFAACMREAPAILKTFERDFKLSGTFRASVECEPTKEPAAQDEPTIKGQPPEATAPSVREPAPTPAK